MPRRRETSRVVGLIAPFLGVAIVVGVVGDLTGCKSGKKADSKGDAAVVVVPADAAPPPTPGLVYVAVSREGVVELKGGKFRRVIATQGRIDDVAVTASGDVYAVADAQILLARSQTSSQDPSQGDGEAEVVGNRRAPGVARRIAAGPGGVLWAISGKGLWQLVDGTWSADETFPRPRTVVDIVATRGGRVVAAARDAAFVKEVDGWRAIELPDPPPEPKPVAKVARDGGPVPVGDQDGDSDVDGMDDGVDEEGGSKKRTFVRSLALGADDLVYASTSSGVYQLGDSNWKRVAESSVGAFAVGSDGTIVAAAESGAILWGAQSTLVEREVGTLGVAATEIDAIATDSMARVWIATDGGIVLANRLGEPQAVYSAGSQAAIPGRVVAILVIEPPTILPEIAERRIGAIAGTIVGVDKKSVAGVDVEICARPDTLFRGSPCAEAPFRASAKTDDKGAFRIEGVPAGRYGFALKRGPDWVVDLTIECCGQLFSDSDVSLPKIAVE